MRIPIRTLSAEDAEVTARTTVSRIVTNGRVECHGLHWYSHALRSWEQKQKESRRSRRVELRVDELNLGIVYVDVPDRGYGPIKANSTQPEFTENLSLYELNKLKAELKKKHIASRIGRLADTDALALRIEHFEALDHKNDPVAFRRFSENRAQMRDQRMKLNEKKKRTGPAEDTTLKHPPESTKPEAPKSGPPDPTTTRANPKSSTPVTPPGSFEKEKPSATHCTQPRKMKSSQIKRKAM
nr:Mu transposase C-terminal domain-containing protein [Oceanococcus sp. HetDA_MAG_MS8]